MRKHTLRLQAALVLLLTGFAPAGELPTAKPDAVGVSPERLLRLDRLFEGYVNDSRLAGAVVLVARRGAVIYLRAYGKRDRETHHPMRPDTIFRIASQTKALVSTGIMILQEEGRLLITDPVGKYLPEFLETRVAEPQEAGGYRVIEARRPIVIRELLTHTAGIGYGGGIAGELWEEAGIQGWYFADRTEPISATVTRMASLPFSSQPGEKWVYGYSTDILGALIEKVSGLPLNEFLEKHIFTPLGMGDTHFYLPPDKRDRLAVVYGADEKGQLTRAPDTGTMTAQGHYVDGPRTSFSGGAGLLATARDYARFLQMLLNGGELDGARILSPNSVRLMTSNHLREIPFRAGLGFGLGFYVVTDLGARGIPGSVGEYGWGGAYHSTYWVDPQEGLVVVYMTQLIPAGRLDDHGKLRALVYQALR